MKLPEVKKEKLKIIMAIVLGAFFAVYAAIVVIVRPLLDKEKKRREEITELREKLEEADKDVSGMMRSRRQNTTILEEIVETASKRRCVLVPRLGNYQLGAKEYVERSAKEAGVEIESIREIGITQMPTAPTKKSDNALKSYSQRISLQSSLHGLIRLMKSLEAGNPYLTASNLTIASRDNDPGNHQISFELQWPVWTEPEMGVILENRLQEARNFSLTGKKPGDRSS